jgi:oxalate decarboxylase/phosphoglucose isomerase-like protein (cupin superfamily)
MLSATEAQMMRRSAVVFGAGMTMGALVMAGAMHLGPAVRAEVAAPPQGAVRFDSRIVLENELVRVKDVTFPPGVPDTGMHTHDLAHVGVILTPGSLTFVDPDGTRETVKFEAGTVGFRGANATHMVANPGTQPMRVIEVEIKR